MRVEWLSREMVIEYIHRDYLQACNYNLISISDSQGEKKAIRSLWQMCDTAGLHARFYNFLDIDDAAGRFTEDKAKSIVDFIATSKANRKNICVHCWLGVSRSAAVAKFAQDYFGYQNLSLEGYTLYNRYVYSKLLQTLGENYDINRIRERFE